MANPQPDRFVRFSKELYDAFLRTPMSAGRTRVCLVIVRMTYGDRGRRQASVSLGALEKATGRSRSALKEDIDDLLAEGVLIEVQAPSCGRARIVALNKDYQTWGRFSVDPEDIPGFLRHDWDTNGDCQADPYRQAAPDCAAAAHPAVPAERTEPYRGAAPTKEKTMKTKTSSSAKCGNPVITAPSETDWRVRADELLARSAFGPDLQRLAELLAAANKTGKVTMRRVVCDLYEPLIALETQLPTEAVRHGLRVAIAAGVPNARYVAKAAHSHLSRQDRTDTLTSQRGDLSDYDTNFLTNGAI